MKVLGMLEIMVKMLVIIFSELDDVGVVVVIYLFYKILKTIMK